MHIVRGLRIEEMDDEELGALYVQLKREQLTVETAKAVIAIDVELGLVSQEIESRDKFFTNGEKEKKELSPEEEAFWKALGPMPDPIPEFKLPDLQGRYPEEEESLL